MMMPQALEVISSHHMYQVWSFYV